MIMNIKHAGLVFMFVCFVANHTLIAQDIHFSQFQTSPLNLNPAQSGFFQGSHRFSSNYKNQWQSVTTPYRTFSGTFDMRLFERNDKMDMIGGGLVFNTDKAGDANYGTTQAYLNISYIKTLNRQNTQFIAFGIQPGFVQRSFDPDKLIFDSQYDGKKYDPDLPHGEFFDRNSFLFFDYGAGINWFYDRHKNTTYKAGVALFHLNEPNQSVFNEPTAIVNRKLLAYFKMQFPYNENVDAYPALFYARQGNFQEIIVGSHFKYIRNPEPFNYSTFNMGLFLRFSDALIVAAGFDYLDYTFGVSYDINISRLNPASRYRGGLELSLSYIIDSKKSYVKRMPCPIF